MVIPAWLARRIAIMMFIFMEIFLMKGYISGLWPILVIGANSILVWVAFYARNGIRIAEKKEN